jgi:hypothetical protein
MDNEFMSPHSEHPESEPAHVPPANGEAIAPDAATVIEQVRELLFGDHRRATDGALKSIEDRLAALTATIEARFADLERRLEESRASADRAQEGQVEAIGVALTELGDRIKGLIVKPPQ